MNTETKSRARHAAAFASLLLAVASSVRADAVTDWNVVLGDVVADVPNPAAAARAAVITHIAVFEAVNSILGEYEPYRYRIKAAPGSSPDAATIAAAHAVLVKLHPEKAARIDAEREKSLAAIAEGPDKAGGIAVGIAAAAAILAQRAHDGFDAVIPYTPGARPGDYQATPPDFTPAFMPGLGEVDTFVIRNGRQFRSAPPPDLRSKEYARDVEEVKREGAVNSADRSEDLALRARFYAVTDADRIYYPAARQVASVQGKTLSGNARLFALLSMAIWDGIVACFETKYHFALWRPVTAIRAANTDQNPRTHPDANWEPLVFTPPFPAYPSGHASFGGAARVVLEDEFGADGHDINLTNPAMPGVVLHYTAFKQITDDIDESRINGGVHFRFDQEAGALLGKRVGEYVLRHALLPACDHRNRGRRRSQPDTRGP
jgi:hypothetical protein